MNDDFTLRPREEYQEVFCDFLERNGFDSYGYKEGSDSRTFENDTFIIRPYYWGDDEDIIGLPNFEYKPIGLKIWWYKYPMRGGGSNFKITPLELSAMLRRCETSLKEATT